MCRAPRLARSRTAAYPRPLASYGPGSARRSHSAVESPLSLTTPPPLPARTAGLRRLVPDRRSRVRILVGLVVFAYLVVLRTRHISETFWLLGDQILYWKIALGSWRDLPLGGGPSSVGGTTLGPAFLWIIWAVRHVVGPWVDNLPHAGGIGVSIIQSAADACLLGALWQRVQAVALALPVTVLVATAPYDMALTATIWNPPVAVALVKLTIALVLSGGSDGSIWWGAAATATALLAVQTHSSAIFVAVPVIVSLTARELLERRPRRAAVRACASLAVIVVPRRHSCSIVPCTRRSRRIPLS